MIDHLTGYYCIIKSNVRSCPVGVTLFSLWTSPFRPVLTVVVVEIQNYPYLYLNPTAESVLPGQICKLHGIVIKLSNFHQFSTYLGANQNIWQADNTMISMHIPPEESSFATRSRSSRCLFLFPFPSSEPPRGVESWWFAWTWGSTWCCPTGKHANYGSVALCLLMERCFNQDLIPGLFQVWRY